MPAKLLIPSSAEASPRQWKFHLRPGPRIRGREARRRAVETVDAEQRQREALMTTVLVCFCLWGGFWLQLVIGFFYASPQLYGLTDGNWTLTGGLANDPDPTFFVHDPEKHLPFSVAGNFVLAAATGSALALVGVWLRTRKIQGKWRMRFAVLLFCVPALGFSIAGVSAKAILVQNLEQHRERLRKKLSSVDAPMEKWLILDQLEQIDDELETLDE